MVIEILSKNFQQVLIYRQNVHSRDTKRYILNKYRVFLTRAREGMVIFVPKGDSGDSTRVPGKYEDIADYLKICGVTNLCIGEQP